MDEAWLNTVRLARDAGDISSLFPPGVKSLVELPYNLHNAILQALGFLSMESLPKDERPPKRIWLDGEEMEKWWAEVERMREAKLKGDGEAEKAMSKNALRDKLLVGFKK